MSFAAQCPSWHRQPPPQSSVPPRHSWVHIVPAHAGAAAFAPHEVGWQHADGAQSASVLQGSVPGTILPAPRVEPGTGNGRCVGAAVALGGGEGSGAGGGAPGGGGVTVTVVGSFERGGPQERTHSSHTKQPIRIRCP